MAIVAMPWRASVEATANGAPCLLSVKPCPKMATGQPPTGTVPAGTIRLNSSVLILCATGTPVRVGIGGMNFCGVSQSGDSKLPNATAPTARGKMPRAATGTVEVLNATGFVPTWRFHTIDVTLLSGKAVRIVAGAGIDSLILR